jgi:cytochrome d ubiquinol oxidase subunit I
VGGATLSAWWILVANAWMQFPAGMDFNPETARNELTNFFEVAFSPVAVNKFLHTVISSWMLGAAFVVGISAWYLLKKREIEFAKKSIRVAAIVGVAGICLSFWTGHGSAQKVAKHQPMKLAAMEGLYKGGTHQDLLAFGLLTPNKEYSDSKDALILGIKIPINGFLSWIAYGKTDSYVAGITDIINGGYPMYDGTTAMSFSEKNEKGKLAQQALKDYRAALKAENEAAKAEAKETLDANIKYFGYGFFKDAKETIPPVGLTFYAFHAMVILGGYFLIFFIIIWYLNKKGIFEKNRWLQWLAVISVPLAYITSQAGWVVAEVGRQPWSIQDVLPLSHSVSNVPTTNVITTFFVFLGIFSILLIAEMSIMIKAIKTGPSEEE